ncbi:MAG TPA: CRTAC1 family protein [Puia sp.]|nr:CRTAC1 family protein [Puia sp.]
MKWKTLIIIITGAGLLVFLTSLTYVCIKRYHNDREKEAMQLYRAGLKKIYHKDNAFAPEAQLAFYDSLELDPSLSKEREMIVEFFKAVTLIKLGQETQATEILSALMDKTEASRRNKFGMEVRRQLALSYIRTGEKNNCIANHSSGSCIFPIQASGVYIDPDATRKGIGVYEKVLQLDPDDLESRWMLNVAYMAIGEYPRKVPSAWLIPGMDTDTSEYKVNAFTDYSRDLKLNEFRSQAGGAIVDDFNNDGYLDIVTSSWDLEEPMHYFRNNADGSFTDVSKTSGLDGIKGGLNMIQADYNNDGFTDILVLRGAWMGEFGKQPKTLLRNNGNGTFTDVTVESGILSFHPTQTAAWADFNNDGWLDLFIGNETLPMGGPHHPSELYINNQDGTFTNVTVEAGCEKIGFMKGVCSGDYNRDGWPDIIISCRDGQKVLLKNKGLNSRIPQFEDATHEAGLDRSLTFTFPTWFFDYDNDGWPDIFMCGYQFQGSLAVTAAAEALHQPFPPNTSLMYLYRNNHDGTFTDVSSKVGLDKPVFAMGSNFGDLDNDGWLDMYLGTGNPEFQSLVPNRLFKNIGGQRFADVTGSARVGNLQKGHGVAFADIDNDGDQDIFLEVGGALKGDGYFNSLYINPGQDNNNWISILLQGVKCNRSAIGAHIALSFREEGIKRTVHMDVNSGGSFGCNPFRKEIGIGKASIIDELAITWPTTGTVQVFKDIKPCQFITIREGKDQIEKLNLTRLNFKHGDQKMNMIGCVPER